MWASIIAGLAKPVADTIDELHTSDEEKGKIRLALMQVQVGMGQKLLEYEQARLEAQSKVVQAEAKSEHMITSIWRPVTMLTFLALVVAYYFGWVGDHITEELAKELFTLIQLGLGGYVVGRSAEKVVPQIAQVFKKDA